MISLLDKMYARYSNGRLFFRQGWGDMDLLRDMAVKGLQVDTPPCITITWSEKKEREGATIRQGFFASPFQARGFPYESQTAYVEWVLPSGAGLETPVCLHFAATGDEGFERRRRVLASPLTKRGISSLILENPFYGKRRPLGQHGKMLRCVSDLFLMGRAAFMEGRALLAWLHREGYSRSGVSGISMGGHMAALVGALSSTPVAIVPCIAPHSPSAVFTEGTLRHYCAWETLGQGPNGRRHPRAYMKKLLDIMDIRFFPPPQAPSAALMVAARNDAYIPSDSMVKMHNHWPGSGLHWLNAGHVGAFLFYRRTFIETIVEAFAQL